MKGWIVAVALSVSLLGGCATAVMTGTHQGPQSGDDRTWEEAREDRMLTRAVTERLVDDRQVRAMAIQVKTYRGRVTLTGSVVNRIVADRAVELAARVRGVQGVVDRLEVKP